MREASQPVCQCPDPTGGICGLPVEGRQGASKYHSREHADLARQAKQKNYSRINGPLWYSKNKNVVPLRDFARRHAQGFAHELGYSVAALTLIIREALGVSGPDRRQFGHWLLKGKWRSYHAYLVFSEDEAHSVTCWARWKPHAKAYSEEPLPTPPGTIEITGQLPEKLVELVNEYLIKGWPKCIAECPCCGERLYTPGHVHAELWQPHDRVQPEHSRRRRRRAPRKEVGRGLWLKIIETRLASGLLKDGDGKEQGS